MFAQLFIIRVSRTLCSCYISYKPFSYWFLFVSAALNISELCQIKGLTYAQIFKQDRHCNFLHTFMSSAYSILYILALNVSEPCQIKGLAYTQIFKQDRHCNFLHTFMLSVYSIFVLLALNVSKPCQIKGLAYAQIFKQDRH